jgi:ketosteroid isomerase-like protein
MSTSAPIEIRRVIRATLEAIEERDWDALSVLFREDATIFVADGETERPEAWSPDPEQISARFWRPGIHAPSTFSIRRLAIDVLGNNAFVWVAVGPGRTRELDVVLVKEEGSWLINHFHLRFLDQLRPARRHLP